MKKSKNKKERSPFLVRVILILRALKERIKKIKPLARIKKRQSMLSHYTGRESCEEAKLSYGFGIAKIISAVLLVSILTVTVIFGSGIVSFEKIYYMAMDIGYIKSFAEGAPDALSYSKPVQNQVFGDFKNGLLVASDSEIKLFTSTGRATLTEGSEFVNPKISTSSGYALIYDQGRNYFAVYNSFVKLYSERTDHAIANADMSENGCFLIVTSSPSYSSVLKIYDSRFKLIGEYNKNDKIISASLSADGRYAAVVSLTAQEGRSIVVLNILDCKKNEVLAEKRVGGSMPYMCEFLSNDRIALLLDDCFVIFDKKGGIVREHYYLASPQKIDIQGGRLAILLSDKESGDKKTAEIFDSDGNRTFSKSISGSVKDMKLADGYIYLLGNMSVKRISTAMGSESVCEVSADKVRLVIFSDGRAAACSQNSAIYISFD